MRNASFSFDDTVVVVFGQTLDQCGDAIDVTVMEKNTNLYSTRDTKTYTEEAEVKKTDDESIVVDFC
jgi:hypothetical protein